MRPALLAAVLASAAAMTAARPAAAGAPDAAPAPAPTLDEAARQAVEAIRNDITNGRTGWWKENADPAVKFVGTYTGLGSDVVTLATASELESVWPAWKGLSEGLEKFGVAFTIYTCASHAADGRHDLAALTALKDFLKLRLSKISGAGALYAAGAGVVDYSLNELGAAAVSQVNDDFYTAYRAFQMRSRGRAGYIDLIRSGGQAAVNRELDRFWDDAATAGIRGYALLESQDPDYQAHFRTRFVREELLSFLAAWAEREADRARLQAEIQAGRLAEELLRTQVVLEVRVLEAQLGEGAAGYKAEALHKDKVIAAAAVNAGRLDLRFPLGEIIERRNLPRSITVKLSREGDTLNAPRTFSVELRSSRRAARPAVAAGKLRFVRAEPVYVRTRCPVEVTVGGPEAAKVGYVSIVGLSGNRDFLGSGGRSGSGGGSAQIKSGKGSAVVTAGKYLLEAGGEVRGPFTVRGAATLSFETRTSGPADAVAAPAADLSAHAPALSAAAGRIRGGADWQGQVYAEVADTVERYRQAVRSYEADCRRAMEGWNRKAAEAARDAGLKPEQKDAARKECYARRDEISKAMSEALKADSDRMNAAQKELQTAEKERRERQAQCGRNLGDASRRLGEAVRALEESGRAAAGAFEEISRPVQHAYLDYLPMAKVEEEMVKVRAALTKVEAELPTALKLADELPALLDAYRKAVAEMDDAGRYTGDETRVDRYLLDKADGAAARAAALRGSDLGAKAREFLARCEKRLERRKERARKTARLVAEIEAAAAKLPATAGADLSAAHAALRPRAERLFTAFAKDEKSWPEWPKLAADLDRAVADRKALLGDLLEGNERADTAFSQFRDRFDASYTAMAFGDLPADWWTKLRDVAWSKVEARDSAAGELLELRADVRRLLALGKDRAACAAELDRRVEALRARLEGREKGRPAGGTEERLAAVEEVGKALDALPRPLVAELRAKWDELRRELVKSGAVEAHLRGKGRSFAVFHTIDKQAHGRAFYWPESLPAGQKDQWMAAVLRIDGMADDEMAGVATSFDGGRTWQPARWLRHDPGFAISLPRSPEPWFTRGFRLRLDLPGGRRPAEFKYLPPVRYPEK